MTNGNGYVAAAIAEQINDLLSNDENLETRTGMKLVLRAFSQGMIFVAGMDKRLVEMETAYIRFTNTMNGAMELEEENKSRLNAQQTQINSLHMEVLPEIKSTLKVLKWLGGIITAVITLVITMLITGQLQLVRP